MKQYALRSATVVLVHGAWADGRAGGAIAHFRVRGLPVVVVRNLAASMADDVAAIRSPPGLATCGARVSTPAGAGRPCWYIVSGEHRTVSAALQRDLAKRRKARTAVVETSHILPLFVSQTLADLGVGTTRLVPVEGHRPIMLLMRSAP